MKKILFAVLLSCTLAHGYSYTAYSFMTPDKTFMVNPFIYADLQGFVGSSIIMGYGMNGKSDIWFTMSMGNDGSTDFSSTVRYDFGNNNILALLAGPWCMSPQYHIIWENDRVALQANVAVQFSYDYMDKPAMFAVLSPVLKLFKSIDVFVEANPGYYMQDGDFANLWYRPEGFGLDLVGGFGFSVGSVIFSVACPVYDVNHDPVPTAGLWFAYCK